MKYLHCKDPNIKAMVALKAIKGESISYLSKTYHVSRSEIVIWRQQLVQEMHLEKWMVEIFSKQPYFIKKTEEREEY